MLQLAAVVKIDSATLLITVSSVIRPKRNFIGDKVFAFLFLNLDILIPVAAGGFQVTITHFIFAGQQKIAIIIDTFKFVDILVYFKQLGIFLAQNIKLIKNY